METFKHIQNEDEWYNEFPYNQLLCCQHIANLVSIYLATLPALLGFTVLEDGFLLT